ncbi:lrr receptor-like serine/threonine-protein kinase ios1 [Quercus suber]|uniref:Lrr receptor-like serine/threonine-protein kinase ios1 n=1 Tax=Quercus suber TaxID=58331 RepID=A0AAW0JCH2_QUESU
MTQQITKLVLKRRSKTKISSKLDVAKILEKYSSTNPSIRPSSSTQLQKELRMKAEWMDYLGESTKGLITGRPAIIIGPEENTHILDWVYPIIEQGDIQKIVDPRLKGEFHANSAWKATKIALSCVQRASIQMSDMSEVSVELKECLALEMTHARSQRMATMGNKTISSNSVSLEIQSDIDALARGLIELKFGRVSQRSDRFEFWTYFPKVRWIEVWTYFPEVRWFDFERASQGSIEIEFGYLPRGPLKLNLDVLLRGLMDLVWTSFPEVRWIEVWTCFLDVQGLEFWTCFLEVQWIDFGHAPRGPLKLNLDVFLRSDRFEFGRASQRSMGSSSKLKSIDL